MKRKEIIGRISWPQMPAKTTDSSRGRLKKDKEEKRKQEKGREALEEFVTN